MKLYIKEIKLWFVDEGTNPISYFFENNKINVITGGSTTGKTSIWTIIDYCLVSDKNNIPNEIFEKVSYFGINIIINGKEISIIRKSPKYYSVEDDFYLIAGSLSEYPMKEDEIKKDILLSFLNDEFGMSAELLLKISSEMKYSSMTPSFRYFLLFNSLTESIIGSKSAYFDTSFYNENLHNSLKIIFNSAVVGSDYRIIEKENDFKNVIEDLKKIKNAKERNKINYNSTNKDLKIIIKELQELGLIDYSYTIKDIEDTICYLIEITNFKKIINLNDNLIAEINNLKTERQEIIYKQNLIKNYKKEFKEYNKSIENNIDSLYPVKFLHKRLESQFISSPETHLFLKGLNDTLENLKNTLEKSKKPLDLNINESELKLELRNINNLIENAEKEFLNNTEVENIYQIGQIQNKLQIIQSKFKISDINDEDIHDLEYKSTVLGKEIKQLENSRKDNLKLIDGYIKKYFDKIPSLKNYIRHKIHLDIDKMDLVLTPPKEELPFPYENIGSKSNYMYLHLSFYLGLHFHFLKLKDKSIVPSFLFIDQPSIPYFSDKENNDNEKLIDAFKLLNTFMHEVIHEMNEEFQIILVEHASPELWKKNNLSYFHTVDEFTGGKGLLPKHLFN